MILEGKPGQIFVGKQFGYTDNTTINVSVEPAKLTAEEARKVIEERKHKQLKS